MLTEEQMRDVLKNTNHMVRNSMHGPFWPELEGACRAIESAATEPLLQRIAELEHQLEEARKDAERYRFIRDANRSSCIDGEIGLYAMESLDEYVDAAMEDEARIVGGEAMKGQP